MIGLKGYLCGSEIISVGSLEITYSEAEFKEFEPRLKFKPRLKYTLKMYSIFQDLSRRSIETGFEGI